ncbi:hypothetical protein DERP_011365 [Dermatophagoides pteronyssinus]|uniref:Uncharacterized protein n=1 Tax=Dermatophagoides pteronyssinus TaxID=6956 RepID=A0ABQ8J7H4_DERPT|nr:hypothetical protein DERP_011365 [Dermatophagoides pteronyssinus]
MTSPAETSTHLNCPLLIASRLTGVIFRANFHYTSCCFDIKCIKSRRILLRNDTDVQMFGCNV